MADPDWRVKEAYLGERLKTLMQELGKRDQQRRFPDSDRIAEAISEIKGRRIRRFPSA